MPVVYWNTVHGPPGPNLLYGPPWATYTDYTNVGSTSGSTDADWTGSAVTGGIAFTSYTATDITLLCDCTVVLYMEGGLQTDTAALGHVTWLLFESTTGDYLDSTRYMGYSSIEPTTYPSGRFQYQTLTTPPIRYAAGDSFSLRMVVTLTAGTATFANNRLSLTRVA